MINFYPEKSEIMRVATIKKQLNIIHSKLDFYNDSALLSEIMLEDIDEITAAFFKMSIDFLSASELIERESGHFYDNGYRRICTENIPVSISLDRDIFRIKTPLTIKRRSSRSKGISKENYLLQTLVEAKLNDFTDRNPGIRNTLFDIFSGKNLDFYIIRYAKAFVPNIHCDNDNIEQSRVQNLICNFAGVSDRADKMDVHLCFRLCDNPEDCGTEFILTIRKNHLKML